MGLKRFFTGLERKADGFAPYMGLKSNPTQGFPVAAKFAPYMGLKSLG